MLWFYVASFQEVYVSVSQVMAYPCPALPADLQGCAKPPVSRIAIYLCRSHPGIWTSGLWGQPVTRTLLSPELLQAVTFTVQHFGLRSLGVH